MTRQTPKAVKHNRPLRRTRSDLVVMAIIAVCCLAAVIVAIVSAPINRSQLVAADEPHQPSSSLDSVPEHLSEVARFNSDGVSGSADSQRAQKPLVANGVLIVAERTETGTRVRGLAPETAQSDSESSLWHYDRDAELCGMSEAWDKVVLIYRINDSCGDVVALDAATGNYSATRSARAPDEVSTLSSNDRVGIVNPQRVELWRSDMVRTVEFGDVDAPQEPDNQPFQGCDIHSALTRTELLAVAQTCPDQPDTTMLRLMETTPEDSRAPEITAEIAIDSPRAQVIAVGEHAAAVYVSSTHNNDAQIMSFNDNGERTAQRHIAEPDNVDEFYQPATGDLPHHITWFDGQRLYLLTPTELAVEHIVDLAVGTGVAVGDRVAVPVNQGIAVVNWTDGNTERTIQVDRDGYEGPISLELAGDTLVEQRGETTVLLR